MTEHVQERTYEESCALLDEVVGRCVRDAEFGDRVLEDPVIALAPYGLHQHELDDFLTLRRDHREEAAAGWAGIRTAMEVLAAARSTQRPEPEGVTGRQSVRPTSAGAW